MLTTFIILHGMVDTDSKVFFERSTSVTRGHNLKLFKFASSSSRRKNYLSNRVIRIEKYLPAIIVNAESVIEFEKLYDDFCGNEKYNYEYATNTRGFNRPMASLSLIISYYYYCHKARSSYE